MRSMIKRRDQLKAVVEGNKFGLMAGGKYSLIGGGVAGGMGGMMNLGNNNASGEYNINNKITGGYNNKSVQKMARNSSHSKHIGGMNNNNNMNTFTTNNTPQANK